jgi:hydrogenase maturation protease
MNLELAKKIADAVLYEGYILYPYRASAIKNRQRFNFGVLMPGDWADRQQAGETGRTHAECLIEGDAARIDVRVRFLQLVAREVGRVCPGTAVAEPESLQYEIVPELAIDGEILQSWEEAIDREIVAPDLNLSRLAEAPFTVRWESETQQSSETLRNADGQIVGAIVRRHQPIQAVVTIHSERLGDHLWKLKVDVENVTRLATDVPRFEAQLSALASAHVLLAAQMGQFVSLLEPPNELAEQVAGCQNRGLWPVLVGSHGQRDLMLASPIILYDYPQVAPESDGDYFDGTEMDEMLALRVMTLTDDEKRAMRGVDRRAREILERTEALSQASLMHLHGTIRDLKEVAKP